MVHDLDQVRNQIDQKLMTIKERNKGSLKTISDEFVYAFGPFMVMTPGFEHECDEIALTNVTMRLLQHAAYLIRSVTAKMSYGDAKRLCRDFIVTVHQNFPESTEQREHEALIHFANSYLIELRTEQRTGKFLESFMTNSAPIVPYQPNTLVKKSIDGSFESGIDYSDEIQSTIQKNSDAPNLSHLQTLKEILLNNLSGILSWIQLTTVLPEEVSDQSNLMELDHLVIGHPECPPTIVGYYFLATINYYQLPFEIFDKYLKFFKSISKISSSPQSYDSFESMINQMAAMTSATISMEAWNDSELDSKADQVIDDMVSSAHQLSTDQKSELSSKYNLDKILNYISVQRHMEFNEGARRFFLASLSDRKKLLNVNDFGNGVFLYELDNDTLVCPFVDMRDWKTKMLVLDKDNNDLFISSDFHLS